MIGQSPVQHTRMDSSSMPHGPALKMESRRAPRDGPAEGLSDPAVVHSERAFVDELEMLVPQMRAFARSLCRDRDLADDMVQETCLKAWAARERFIPGAPMKPWLFRILRNTYVQHGRRAWRSAPLDPADAEKTLIAPDNAQWASDFNSMQAAMTHLPPKQREAVLFVLAAGFSYEEAGQLLGCSEGTVKSRVSRGREALITLMDGRGRAA